MIGNTVLHMVVVAAQLGMYGYALRHPRKNANPYIKNNRGLTCLTLSCELGRDIIFKEMLELSCTEFWRYSNITCCGYPLGALDSIQSDGQTSEQSEKANCVLSQCFVIRLGIRVDNHSQWDQA